jgi:multidrug efflux pump subunit AcrB
MLKGEGAHQSSDDATSKKPNAFARVYNRFNRGFDRFQERYIGALTWVLTNRRTVLAVFVAVVAFTSRFSTVCRARLLSHVSMRGRLSCTCGHQPVRGSKPPSK